MEKSSLRQFHAAHHGATKSVKREEEVLMKSGCIAKLLVLFGCLAALIFALSSAAALRPGLTMDDSCPPGQTPTPFVDLAEVPLPTDVLLYSKVALSRIVVQPGETLDIVPSGFTAY
jgi:hypothetical protein